MALFFGNMSPAGIVGSVAPPHSIFGKQAIFRRLGPGPGTPAFHLLVLGSPAACASLERRGRGDVLRTGPWWDETFGSGGTLR